MIRPNCLIQVKQWRANIQWLMNPALKPMVAPMFHSMGKTVGGSLLAAALLTTAACRRDDAGESKVAVIGAQPILIENVDAPLTGSNAVMRSTVAQGLVRFDSKGQIVPGLAERWNVSNDGLSYIFRLKTGTWPDGRKINTGDIARIIARQVRVANGNPLADTLGAVSDVVPMTDRVIEISLIAPRPNLLQLLAQPEMGIVRGDSGSGPFVPIKPSSTDETALLLEHHVPVIDDNDLIERVRLGGTQAPAGIAAFKNGQLDLLLGGTFVDLPLAQKADLPRASLRYDPAIGLFGLMPVRKGKMTDDRDIRRLLSRAVDRGAIISQFQVAGLTPRATILQSGLDGGPTVTQPDWLNDQPSDQQAQLAAEAKQLFGGIVHPEIRLFIPPGPGGDILFARLKTDWAALGLITVRAPNRATADYAMVDDVAPSTSPAWFLRHFQCAVAPICLSEVDRILADARTSVNAAERAVLLGAAATKMDDAQLFIPIAAPIRWSLASRSATGFIENPFARHTLVGLKDARAREDAQ